MFDDGCEPSYETIQFFNISSGVYYTSDWTTQSIEPLYEPTTLVAQVSYGGNKCDGNNWIVDRCSTHHMYGHHTEFLNMVSYGYVDGVTVKGLSSNTKACGIGSCIFFRR